MGQLFASEPPSAAEPAGPRRPLRVLCLSGNRSNAVITDLQVENLQLAYLHGLELSFLDGPFESSEAYDPEVQRVFPGQAFATWNPPGAACDRVGLAAGVAHVRSHLEANGPFDGFFGFSMGALVAALVLDVGPAATASEGAGESRFLLAACSSYFAESQDSGLRLAGPSLHLIGAKDQIAFKSRRLAHDVSGSTYEMPYAGHELPMACCDDAKLQEAIRGLLARALEIGGVSGDGGSPS